MLYCISDLHGEYEKYIAILKKLNLSSADTLFIIGDICDRGEKPCAILLDMMERPNIIPLAGNHDVVAAHVLKLFSQEITDDLLEKFDDDTLYLIQAWMMDVGVSTLKDFRKRSAGERERILNYLKEFRFYEEVSAGGNEYVIVHGGLENFLPEKKLSDYSPDELIYSRTDYSKPLFSGSKYLVTGHTPTMAIPENPTPGYIVQTTILLLTAEPCSMTEGLGPSAWTPVKNSILTEPRGVFDERPKQIVF